MARPSHLILTSNRDDQADWLTEMLDNGWKLISVDQGIFYFENVEVVTAMCAEALQRDYNANGPSRSLIERAIDAGISEAKREIGV